MHTPLPMFQAQRTIALLEEAAEKVAFLNSVTPDLYQHRDELSRFIGDEISRAIAEQRALEKRYEELMAQRAELKMLTNKAKYKAVQEEIQDVSRSLKDSTNNLVRSLKDNPNVSGNIIKIQRDRAELVDVLRRTIQEVADKGTFVCLVQRVEEDNAAQQRLNHLKQREQELNNAVVRLEKELTEEQAAYAHTVAEQRAAVTHLKAELADVRSTTHGDTKLKRRETAARTSCIWRGYRQSEREIEAQIRALDEKARTEALVHAQTKEFLEKKQAQLQSEIAQWEERSRVEVANKDRELDELKATRNELLDKLIYLRRRKAKEDQENAENEAEAQARVAKAHADKVLGKQQNRAARVIQRALKDYIKRKKEIEANAPKKKKKGGAKKGKKGKKK